MTNFVAASSGVAVRAETEIARLQQLAAEEARVNRDELAKFYDLGDEVGGELRYSYLWRLSQLEKACIVLERLHDRVARVVPEDLALIRDQIAATTAIGVESRQEALLLLNAAARTEHGLPKRRRASVRQKSVSTPRRAVAIPGHPMATASLA